jgi:excisionase family DNA binding protein
MSTQTVTPENTQPLLSPAEAARLANVSTKTIRREIDRGALTALHAGRQLRIEPADFRRWLEGGTE